MSEQNIDPDLRTRAQRHLSIRVSLARLTVSALALLVMVVSLIGVFVEVGASYAHTTINHQAMAPAVTTDTPTPTPTDTPTPTPTNTPTPTPTATNTPTPVPPPPTSTPTPRPRPSPTATPTTAAPSPSATASVSPTATATTGAVVGGGGNGTPVATPTSGPSSPGGGQPGGGSPLKTALIVLFVLVGLTLSFGGGWLLLRRMLMPNEVKLKPSGARPWTRTRVPSPASQDGLFNTVSFAGSRFGSASHNAGPSNQAFMPSVPSTPPLSGSNPHLQVFGATQGGFEQQGQFSPVQGNFAPNMQGNIPQSDYGQPTPNSGYAVQGIQGQGYGRVPSGYGTPASGFGAFSDSFVPPSPRVFTQGDSSMIPPTTGSHPIPGNSKGYAPASNAFNALYGLSDTSSDASRTDAPGWLDQLGSADGRQLPTTPHPPAARPPQQSGGPGRVSNPNSEWLQ